MVSDIPIAFEAYRHQGIPVIDYDLRVPRKKLTDLNAIIPHSRQTYFVDLAEAEIRLATPRKTAQQVEE